MTTDDHHIHGLPIRDVLALLEPQSAKRSRVAALCNGGFVYFDETLNRYRRTDIGENLARAIRQQHSMVFVASAWHLDECEIRSGDTVEILLNTGAWVPVCFMPGLIGQDSPISIALAGGGCLSGPANFWKNLFRWPPRDPDNKDRP